MPAPELADEGWLATAAAGPGTPSGVGGDEYLVPD